ncbi:MAG: helicase-related protein [Firmicutes bacterium]|nr:helicase-related protein [Bacillota bacterium]
MEQNYICPRCGNKDIKFIGIRNGHSYCRLCIGFQGKEASGVGLFRRNVAPSFDYCLSPDQIEISNQVCENYAAGTNTLIHAVCGAGKTELVFAVMARALSLGQRVGFAIPRRDVVMELTKRLAQTFPSLSIVSVYGGNHDEIEGDIVVLTTHQLYRYNHYFDLLIVDEIDAFPFKGNKVLVSLFKRSVKGHYVVMSATPSDEVVRQFSKPGYKMLRLYTRYHGHRLPEPKIVILPGIFKLFFLIKTIRDFAHEKKPCFIFVATIDKSELLYRYLSIFLKNGNCVHSKKPERSQIIEDFRQGKYQYLVTTAVLERGVTIKDLQVIIYSADHHLYDSRSLVQISGRVGRKPDAPEGEVVYLSDRLTKAMDQAVSEIRFANLHVQSVL